MMVCIATVGASLPAASRFGRNEGLIVNFMKVRLWQNDGGQDDEESRFRFLLSFCPPSFCPSEIDSTNGTDAVCSDLLTRSRSQFKVLCESFPTV